MKKNLTKKEYRIYYIKDGVRINSSLKLSVELINNNNE